MGFCVYFNGMWYVNKWQFFIIKMLCFFLKLFFKIFYVVKIMLNLLVKIYEMLLIFFIEFDI